MSVSITKRRIQRLGGSSLIVTIPKSWARKIGLTVGDEVVVVDEGDHLRILPPNSRLVRTLGAATVRLVSFIKRLDPSMLVDCAYKRGYDKLIIELPKSNGVNTDEIVERLAENRYAMDVTTGFGTIEVALADNRVVPKSLKGVGAVASRLLIDVLHGTTSWEDVEEKLAMIQDVVNGLIRNSYKHRVLTCSGENMDPMVLGGIRASLAIYRRLLEVLRDEDPRDAEDAVRGLADIMSEVAGGIANRSGKRLVEVLEAIGRAEEKVASSSASPEFKAYAASLLTSLRTVVENAICPNILNG